MVSADGAIVNHDVPGPERHSVPLYLINQLLVPPEAGLSYLLHLEPLLVVRPRIGCA